MGLCTLIVALTPVLTDAAHIQEAADDFYGLPPNSMHAPQMGDLVPGRGFARDLVQTASRKEIGLFVTSALFQTTGEQPIPHAAELTIG